MSCKWRTIMYFCLASLRGPSFSFNIRRPLSPFYRCGLPEAVFRGRASSKKCGNHGLAEEVGGQILYVPRRENHLPGIYARSALWKIDQYAVRRTGRERDGMNELFLSRPIPLRLTTTVSSDWPGRACSRGARWRNCCSTSANRERGNSILSPARIPRSSPLDRIDEFIVSLQDRII